MRESALKVDSGSKIPCRTGELNLRETGAGPTFYQLGYIPTRDERTGTWKYHHHLRLEMIMAVK